jgi:hypothetical protein
VRPRCSLSPGLLGLSVGRVRPRVDLHVPALRVPARQRVRWRHRLAAGTRYREWPAVGPDLRLADIPESAVLRAPVRRDGVGAVVPGASCRFFRHLAPSCFRHGASDRPTAGPGLRNMPRIRARRPDARISAHGFRSSAFVAPVGSASYRLLRPPGRLFPHSTVSVGTCCM